MKEQKIQRDALYRATALKCAIARAGQDGGLEGNFDVLGYAETYYKWLTGATELKEPQLET